MHSRGVKEGVMKGTGGPREVLIITDLKLARNLKCKDTKESLHSIIPTLLFADLIF